MTIDGPAGSGKSTVANKLAKRLGLIHLNSGALFRAVGLKAESRGVPLDDDAAIASLAAATEFRFKLQSEVGEDSQRETRLFVDGLDLSERIRTDEAGILASRIGVLPELRQVLLKVQRSVACGQSVVVEGRDAGTVVFPDAEVKFYLDAALEVRAGRRFKELAAKDRTGCLSLADVKRDMQARDQRELTRDVAPLRPAQDAVLIDTSDLSVDDVVLELSRVVEARTEKRGSL